MQIQIYTEEDAWGHGDVINDLMDVQGIFTDFSLKCWVYINTADTGTIENVECLLYATI